MTSNDIPASWLILGFDEIFSQVSTSGKKVKSADVQTEGRFPVVDQGRSFISGYLDDANLVVSENKPLIIFGDHTREIKWIDFPFIPGADGVQVLKPHPEMDTRFLYYFLRSLPIESRGYARHFKIVKDAAYLVPPLAEQIRIAAKLDELLAQVDTLKARIDSIPALLKRFRQSVLTAAVSGKLTEEWRTKKASEGTTAPNNDWKTIRIDQASADEKYSLAIGPFGSNLKVSDYRDDGKPLVFVREIRAGCFGDKKTKFITPEKFDELSAHQISAGDILVTKMGDPPGDVAIYPATAPDAVITADCIKLRVNESVILREYAYYQMKSNFFRQKVQEISAGVAQQKVSLGNFREITLLVPSREEQRKIVRHVGELLAFADQLEARVKAAQVRIDGLTQSILAKALRGELVPQDPNDEPAGFLLERIKAQRAAAPKAKRGRSSAIASEALLQDEK